MNEVENFLSTYQDGIITYGWRIFYASMLCLIAERVWGRAKPSIGSHVRGASYWAAYILITVGFFTIFTPLWAKLGLSPYLLMHLGGTDSPSLSVIKVLSWTVFPVVAVAFGEFFYYWFHRAQHRSKFLWAFHSEHHSLREMSAWNSNHHFTEEIFRIPFIMLPLSMIVNIDPGWAPAIVWLIIGMQGQYEHSHTRISLGPLRYVVADNQFHRIHHSLEQKHWDKNFGSFTSIWDSVFGTAYFPQKDEWPETGLEDKAEPQTLNEFLFRPFRTLFGRGKQA